MSRRPFHVPPPRANETIGGGNLVFRRGNHGRIHPNQWPYEHGTMAGAVGEAERLADLTGDTFEVWARVETAAPIAALAVDVAGGMPVDAAYVRELCEAREMWADGELVKSNLADRLAAKAAIGGDA